MSQEAVLELLNNYDAIWVHNKDPKQPHVRLDNGMCCDGFVDLGEVLKYPANVKILANELYLKILKKINPLEVDWVVGSTDSSIFFEYEMATVVRAKKFGFTKMDLSDSKNPKATCKNVLVHPNERVLLIADVVDSTSSLLLVRDAIEDFNGSLVKFLPFVGCIVYCPSRPKQSEIIQKYLKIKVISLIEQEIHIASPDNCPLCKARSKPLCLRENWDRLKVKY